MSAHDPDISSSNGHDVPAMPEELAESLRSLYSPDLPAPRQLDEAVRAAALARGEAICRKRRLIRNGAWGGLAAAAGLALAVVIWGPGGRPVPIPPPAIAGAAMDINGDGVVDILDALALALVVDGRVEGDLQPAWDFTGSGRIDRDDVDAIAAAAVSLEGGAG